MCDPTGTTFAIASMAIAAASSVTSAIGSKQQADFQADESRKAAKREEIRADQALHQSAQEQRAFDRKAARQQGQQRSAMAASGLLMDSGTPNDILNDTKNEQAIDRQNLAYNGQVNAYDHLSNASSLYNTASNYKAAGNNALAGGLLDAGSSILGKAGGMFGSSSALQTAQPQKIATKLMPGQTRIKDQTKLVPIG